MSATLETADVLLAGTGLRPSVPSSPTTTPASGSCSRECSRYEDAGPGRQRSAGPAARIAARDHHHRRGCAAAATRRRGAAQRRPRCPMTDADAPATVLAVDDDEAKRYILTTWLRRAGHTVIEAATGREALDMVGAVELVLLDVNLPDMTGYEVCRQIKGNPRTAAVPVVQVSATAITVADRAAGLTQGADAYL